MYEELLKPRIMVFEDYPNNPYPLNETVIISNEELDFFIKSDDVFYYRSKFPKNIKILQWWEERDINSDLPKYLKIIFRGRVDEVCEVEQYLNTSHLNIKTITGFIGKREGFSNCSLNSWEIATEEEYLNYKNK